ncbi:MAG: sensor histidine kinase [Acidiferrobacterales bacterium]
MSSKYSLRVRVTIGMLVLVSLSSIVFAVIVYLASEELEHNVLNSILRFELAEFSDKYRQDLNAKPPQSATLQIYLGGQANTIPDELANLKPGIYEDMDLGGRVYHVLISDLGAQRIYLTYDITDWERREWLLILILALGVLVVSSTAAGLGFWLSRALIAPVTQLANRVQALNPRRRQVRLSTEFSGHEVQVIAKAFDRYLRRLDSFVEREQSFTATASHELRTPLAVIRGAAEILAAQPDLAPATRNAVTRIQTAATEMSEFIGALLFLAREDHLQSTHSASACELTEIIPTILDEHRHLLNDKPVALSFTCDSALAVRGPPMMVVIVIGNLLRNAITCTENGSIRVMLQDGTLSIEDTGTGIAADDLEHVFDRHVSGGTGGSGLGLYIVKSICDRYEWKVTLHSTPGKGTTAVLSF